MFSRREFIEAIGAVACLSGCPETEPLPGLRHLPGVSYGSSTRLVTMQDEPDYVKAFKQECALLTPENELKFSAIRPGPESYDFGKPDELLSWSKRNMIKMRGHTLIWYKDSERDSWLKQYLTDHPHESIMAKHITNTVQHYRGQLHSWDVVNEAIGNDGMRPSLWMQALGEDHISRAYFYARAADPDVPLIYNETYLEQDSPGTERRRNELIRMLDRLLAQNTPIDGIGLQSHLKLGRAYADTGIKNMVREITQRGLKVYITEMDVNDVDFSGPIEKRDMAASDMVRRHLETVFSEAKVDVIQTWGITDRISWMHNQHLRKDGSKLRPLPLDRSLMRKPFWFSLYDTLRQIKP